MTRAVLSIKMFQVTITTFKPQFAEINKQGLCDLKDNVNSDSQQKINKKKTMQNFL